MRLGVDIGVLGPLKIHESPTQSVGAGKQSRCRLLVFGGAINQAGAFIDLVHIFTKAVLPGLGQGPDLSWFIDPMECTKRWAGKSIRQAAMPSASTAILALTCSVWSNAPSSSTKPIEGDAGSITQKSQAGDKPVHAVDIVE